MKLLTRAGVIYTIEDKIKAKTMYIYWMIRSIEVIDKWCTLSLNMPRKLTILLAFELILDLKPELE